jgi:NAD(P)-dependent dehydrogenase (short-subunit alcohol dehydrogenase family)
MNDIANRVSLVTGGTEGIGRAVALRLAELGDTVIITGRNAARGMQVLAQLRSIAAHREHAFVAADLALLNGTRALAAAVTAQTARLDAIVCCAGVLSLIPERTSEGLERTLALNYVSRFLLLRLLLPLLSAAPSGRVVLVANAGQYPDTLDLDDLGYERGKPGLQVAGRSQFANDLLAVELAARVSGTQLAVTCVFPGRVKTNVFRNARGVPWYMRPLGPLLQLGALTPEAAADTPVFLAHSPEASALSGKFFGPHRAEIAVPDRAGDPTRRQALWAASEQLVAHHTHA